MRSSIVPDGVTLASIDEVIDSATVPAALFVSVPLLFPSILPILVC